MISILFPHVEIPIQATNIFEEKIIYEPESYLISGGQEPFQGEITCLGAKNFVSKAMIASLLSEGITELSNIPDIHEVSLTKQLLKSIGVHTYHDKSKNTLTLDTNSITTAHVKTPHTGANRMPILLLGALLHRMEEVSIPIPGGDIIGHRKLDFHSDMMMRFGAEIISTEEGWHARRMHPLKGCHITLPYPSVGATENFLFLSVLAEGTSVLRNAAVEPEIMMIIAFLQSMGALIVSQTNRTLVVEGVKKLRSVHMPCLGDRIEAGSWAALACATGGDILLKGIRPDHMGTFLTAYTRMGGGYDVLDHDVLRFYRRTASLYPLHLETDVYPGLSTDWQQPLGVVLTQAQGISVIHETVHANRFGYLNGLRIHFGAKTQVDTHCFGSLPCRYSGTDSPHSASIYGMTPLTAPQEPIEVPDLRGGLAYIMAAVLAEGDTHINNIQLIERGYGDLPKRVAQTTLKVKKIK